MDKDPKILDIFCCAWKEGLVPLLCLPRVEDNEHDAPREFHHKIAREKKCFGQMLWPSDTK